MVGLHLRARSTSPTSTHFTLTVRRLGAVDLGAGSRWRVSGGQLAAVRDGLRLAVDAPGGLPDGAWIQPVDAPYPLPVLAAGASQALPRIGTAGALVDLEYANRVATQAGTAERSEVWLNASAPADVLTLLARQGLIVTDDVSVERRGRPGDGVGGVAADGLGPAGLRRGPAGVAAAALARRGGGAVDVAGERRPAARRRAAGRWQPSCHDTPPERPTTFE
ncbi:hypothetical protein ACFPIJ_23985 [Dactylosporangium cerinum]|uniref:Uncharacterized protein n=1 Tax=Dactylosporangium cerinum TaxID=1434730 RepID=A0ABV9W0V2_9ACTN